MEFKITRNFGPGDGSLESSIKVTIITVSFNSVKTIEQTINSVLNQVYENIEYIIIDGGSRDGTIDIIKKYSNQISYWITEPDNGIYDAMNKGIKLSNGKFIQFLNSDDSLVDDHSIVSIISQLNLNDEIELLSAPIWVVNEKYKMQRLFDNKISEEDIVQGKGLPHPGMFVRSDLQKQFLFSTEYEIASDYEFTLKCVLDKRKIKYINEPVVYFSDMGKSSIDNRTRLREHLEIVTKYKLDPDVIEACGEEYKRICKKKTLRKLISIAFKKMKDFIVYKTGIYKITMKRKGWKEHRCANNKCRWCKK